MPTVANLVSEELKKNKIKDVFMLTGYGSMYLNDSIQKAGIKFYAARNEASAPMMAEAYAKQNNSIGTVCVTAGPGATNALPGLAEAYVDSSPIIILSGQVERANTSSKYKNLKIRTNGTAEFNIIKNVKHMTKYCKTIVNPYYCIYEIQKALHKCKSGRPGPVWIEIPLDVQSYNIKNLSKLKKYNPKIVSKNKINTNNLIKIFYKLNHSSKPIFIIGNGVKQSKSAKIFKKLLRNSKYLFLHKVFYRSFSF